MSSVEYKNEILEYYKSKISSKLHNKSHFKSILYLFLVGNWENNYVFKTSFAHSNYRLLLHVMSMSRFHGINYW